MRREPGCNFLKPVSARDKLLVVAAALCTTTFCPGSGPHLHRGLMAGKARTAILFVQCGLPPHSLQKDSRVAHAIHHFCRLNRGECRAPHCNENSHHGEFLPSSRSSFHRPSNPSFTFRFPLLRLRPPRHHGLGRPPRNTARA